MNECQNCKRLEAINKELYEALKRLFRLASRNDCGGCINLENACRDAQEALAKAEAQP